jgi:hypothetical protein
MKVFRSARFLLIAFLLCLVPASSFAGVFISIGIAPPVLPVYEQPLCPDDGYIWTPGYWAYGDAGYYWIPGAWVLSPQPGFLWTPAYWGFEGGHYLFHDGYWGAHVGYYGGVNYGFGYMGIGFAGGEWRSGHFFYNTAIMHVGGGFHNVYRNETIIHNTTIINDRHVAYSGGPGGIRHEPTADEKRFSSESHTPPSAVQREHFQAAARDPQQRFSANHGKPATVATARPLSAGANRGAEAGKPEGRPAAQARPEARPAAKAEVRPAAKPEARPAAKAEARPAAKPEERPAAKPEARPAARPEARPAAKPEARPAAKPEARPAARPAAKPESHPAKPSGEKPHGRGR